MKIDLYQEKIPEGILLLIKAIAMRFKKEGELNCPYICWTLRKEIYRRAYDVAEGNKVKAGKILGVNRTTAYRYYSKGSDS